MSSSPENAPSPGNPQPTQPPPTPGAAAPPDPGPPLASTLPGSPQAREIAEIRAALRTPKAAGVAGIAFAVLFAVAFVLVRRAVPGSDQLINDLTTSDSRRRQVNAALYILPFAGIAFLWFMGVIRDRLGEREDRFFATVFLGSGLLFVGMLFVGGASAGGLLAVRTSSPNLSRSVLVYGHDVYQSVLGVYALRMAAVFTIATTTLAGRLGVVPRWLTAFGYLTGLVLMLAVGLLPWLEMLFPLWVFVLSIYILGGGQRWRARVAAAAAAGPGSAPTA